LEDLKEENIQNDQKDFSTQQEYNTRGDVKLSEPPKKNKAPLLAVVIAAVLVVAAVGFLVLKGNFNAGINEPDSDGDGIPDATDSDDDNDGVPDDKDAFPLDPDESLDTDGDGIGNNQDTDDDGDGMPDTWETQYGLDPLDPTDKNLDKDNDGLTNLEEHNINSDPINPDTDNDGVDDGDDIAPTKDIVVTLYDVTIAFEDDIDTTWTGEGTKAGEPYLIIDIGNNHYETTDPPQDVVSYTFPQTWTANVDDSKSEVHIEIKLYDEDGYEDDQCDINPSPDYITLFFDYDIIHNTISGSISGSASGELYASGGTDGSQTTDEDDANISFHLESNY